MKDIEERAPVHISEYLGEMKESVSVLSWIWKEIVGEEGRKRLKKMSVFIVLSILLLSIQPLVFSSVIIRAQGTSTPFLYIALGAMTSLAVAQIGASWLQESARERAWNRIWFHKLVRIHKLFNKKTLGEHSDEGSRLNATAIERARGKLQMILEMILFESGSMLVKVVLTYSLLWYMSFTLGNYILGVAATLLVCVHLAWSLYLNYHVAQKTTPIEKDMRLHGRQTSERMEKITRVKNNGKADAEQSRLEEFLGQILRRDEIFWLWFIKVSYLGRDMLVMIVSMSLVWYGAVKVHAGEWSPGILLPMFVWLTDLCSNLKWIGQAERRINQQLPYIKSLRETLMAPSAFDHSSGIELPTCEDLTIRFENVGLRYGGNEVLRGLNFTINPGDKVALIGASGAGKSSVAKLMLRYEDPTEGCIYVNGLPLADINHRSYVEQLGYVPQEFEVFDGSIRYNLTFGLSEERQAEITEGEIWELMRLLSIDFGERLTEGLETRVGWGGMKLSGGQSQRLMIGAAVIKNPTFMVIDEATSSLDSVTELGVQAGLEEALSENVSALIVAHRLSTVEKICNRFIVLSPLEDVEEGGNQIEAEATSFEELYRISPTFRALADAQRVHIT